MKNDKIEILDFETQPLPKTSKIDILEEKAEL